MDEKAVRRDVLLAFEYAYLHDSWVFPLSDALAGVTTREACWTPHLPDPTRSIWEIVLHLTAWNENIVARMAQRSRGELPGNPPAGDWPFVPVIAEEQAWEEAQRRMWEALNAVCVHIETTPLAAMLDYGNAGYSHLADLLCRTTHLAYHIGQITKIREWYTARHVRADTPGNSDTPFEDE